MCHDFTMSQILKTNIIIISISNELHLLIILVTHRSYIHILQYKVYDSMWLPEKIPWKKLKGEK